MSKQDDLEGPKLLAKAWGLAMLHPYMEALEPLIIIANVFKNYPPDARLCDCEGLLGAHERIAQACEFLISDDNLRAKGDEHKSLEECLGFPKATKGRSGRPAEQLRLALRTVEIAEAFADLEEQMASSNKGDVIRECAKHCGVSEDHLNTILRKLRNAEL